MYDTIQCPDCGTRYKWRPSFANKRMHCRCGCVFTPTPPKVPGKAPTAEEAAPPVASNPFAVTTSSVQQALDQREFDTKENLIAEKILPASLLGGGFLLGVLLTWLVTGKLLLWLGSVAGLTFFEAVVGVPMMLGCMGWMAKTFDEAFGSLGQVLFKSAAVCLGTGMIADVAFGYMMTNLYLYGQDFGGSYFALSGGFCAGLAIYMVCQGLALWPMFRTSAPVTASVVAISYIPRFGMFFVAYYALRGVWI